MGGSIADTVGPGWWAFIKAAAASGDHAFFVRVVEFTAENFPCEDCRDHFKKELLKYNPRNYYDVNNIDGQSPLRWYWMVRDSVGKRLNKKKMSWEDFKKEHAASCHHCAVGSGSKPTTSYPTYPTPPQSIQLPSTQWQFSPNNQIRSTRKY